MIISMLAAAVLFADATPAAAQAAPAQPVAGQAVASTDKLSKNGKICRKEALLGSKLPKTTCYTPEEMAARTAADKENLDKMQRQAGAPSGS